MSILQDYYGTIKASAWWCQLQRKAKVDSSSSLCNDVIRSLTISCVWQMKWSLHHQLWASWEVGGYLFIVYNYWLQNRFCIAMAMHWTAAASHRQFKLDCLQFLVRWSGVWVERDNLPHLKAPTKLRIALSGYQLLPLDFVANTQCPSWASNKIHIVPNVSHCCDNFLVIIWLTA